MYLLGQLISFVLFLFASYASFYIPGKFLLQRTKIAFSETEELFLSTTLGIVVFILSNYIFAWLGIPFLSLFVLGIFFLYVLLRKRELLKFHIHFQDRISLSLIVLGTLAFLSTTFFSGWMVHGVLQFIGVNGADGIMHVGFIRDEAVHFPPMHISLAGFSLRGYHYFYDFLASRFLLFYHFSVFDLQFRLFPLLLSFLYGMGFYVVADRFTKSAIVKRFILFAAYFSQGAVFLYALHYQGFDVTDGFNVAQPISLMTDPSVILSIGLLFAGLYILSTKKKTFFLALLTALFFGTLAEVKVYTGILGIIGLTIYSLIGIVREKAQRIWFVEVLAMAAAVTAVTYFPNNLGVGGLVFYPFLIYQQFIREAIFEWIHWDLIYQVYLVHHNIPRIVQMNLVAFLLFWAGNLGLRAVIFVKIPSILQKAFWQKKENIFLLSTIFFAILIPSLFIQSYSVFNIQQFLWLFIILLSIPVGISLGNLYEKNKKVGRAVLLLVVLALTIIGFGNREITSLFPTGTKTISQQDIHLFTTLKKAIPQKAYIVVLPTERIDERGIVHYEWPSDPYIATMTQHYTYLEDEDLAFNPTVEMTAQQRRKHVYTLMQAMQSCDNKEVGRVLSEVGSVYVVSYAPYPCIATSSAILRTFQTNTLSFYQFR